MNIKKLLFTILLFYFINSYSQISNLKDLYRNVSEDMKNKIINQEDNIVKNIFAGNYSDKTLQISIPPIRNRETGKQTDFSISLSNNIAGYINTELNKGLHKIKNHVYSAQEFKQDTNYHYLLTMEYSIKEYNKEYNFSLDNIKLNSKNSEVYNLPSLNFPITLKIYNEIKNKSKTTKKYNKNLEFIKNFEREGNLIKDIKFTTTYTGNQYKVIYSKEYNRVIQIPTKQEFTIEIHTNSFVYIYLFAYDPDVDKNPIVLYPFYDKADIENKVNNKFYIKGISLDEKSGMYTFFKIIAINKPIPLENKNFFEIKEIYKVRYYYLINASDFTNYLLTNEYNFETKTYAVNIIKN